MARRKEPRTAMGTPGDTLRVWRLPFGSRTGAGNGR